MLCLKEYFKIPKKLDCVIDSDSTRSPDEKTEKGRSVKSCHVRIKYRIVKSLGICPSLTSNREKRLQWQSPVRKSIVKSFGYDPAKLNTYESGFKHEKRRQSEYACVNYLLIDLFICLSLKPICFSRFRTITVKPLSDAERQERRRRLQLEEKLKMEDEVARRQQDDMEFHSQMIQEDSNQRHDGGSHNSVSLLVSSQFAQVGPKMQPVNLPYPSCDSHGSNGLSALHDYSELSATLVSYDVPFN